MISGITFKEILVDNMKVVSLYGSAIFVMDMIDAIGHKDQTFVYISKTISGRLITEISLKECLNGSFTSPQIFNESLEGPQACIHELGQLSKNHTGPVGQLFFFLDILKGEK